MPQPFYPSDLTDAEGEKIAPLLPPEKALGNKRSVNFRDVVNAIFYRADNGIKWRAMPADFPAWETVYGYYRKWVKQGIWEAINGALLQAVRQQAGRNEQPSLGLIDSQSVKQAQKGGEEIGVDGNKKVKGRKRHLVVDVMGWVIGCFVGPANQADVKAAPAALVPALEAYDRLEKVLADQSYQSEALSQQVKEAYGCVLEVVQREGKGFVPEAFRWVLSLD